GGCSFSELLEDTMSVTYTDDTVAPTSENVYVPSFARRPAKQKKVRAWMILAPIAAVALIGGGAAMLMFGFSESIAGWFSGTAVGDQFAALLGTFSLRASGYVVLMVQAMAIAGITAWASRRTLFTTLNDID
ncbi:MAG: hypothetical protein ABW151_13645, partial [Pseudorhodoplanes sp.]